MFRVLLNEVKRGWILYRRYPAEVISGMAVLTITFFALIMGAQYIAGGTAGQFGERLDGIILGYWLWTIAIFALTNTSSEVQSDSTTGTLEQLYLSPYGPVRIFVARAVASFGLNLATSVALLLIMLQLTGRHLRFPPQLVLPLMAAALGAYGMGLALGGVALVFKQVARVQNLLQFLLLFLAIVPVETLSGGAAFLGQFLPLAPGAGVLRDLMARDLSPGPGRIAAAAVNGLAYFLAGVLVFRFGDQQARKRGVLGHY